MRRPREQAGSFRKRKLSKIPMNIQMKSCVALLLLGVAGITTATAAEIRVPTDHPTIQAAINAAADGDSIHIAPGVYTTQLLIQSKTLTLIGQPGTILRATASMSQGPQSVNTMLLSIHHSNVTVRGLTFEGERLAERFTGPGDLLGIYSRHSNCRIEKCSFHGFRESQPGLESAYGILAWSFEGVETFDLQVVGCTFSDNYTGIFVIGADDHIAMNVRLENNLILGPGPLNTSTGISGILIGEGVRGRVANNAVSGFSYIGTGADSPISFGILAINQAIPGKNGVVQRLEIEGNTLKDNQMHVALIKANESTVRNNFFQGTAPGILPLGLAVSGTNVVITNNQFENIPEGIRLLGDDPDFGTTLGTAVDAQLTENRFCDVPTPIQRQSPATAVENGTLLGSCPTDGLRISPAVLVSWPVGKDSWTIEAAPAVNGPWAPTSATVFMQHGRLHLAVPTDDTARFFRSR